MRPDGTAHGVADRQLLARNTLYNLAGQIVPLGAALFAIPGLLLALSAERLGVLTLAWAVVGYFSVFDFGIGRALTKLVAERLGTSAEPQVGSLIWSALVLLTVIGVIIAVALGATASPLVANVLRVPPALHAETVATLYVLAAGIPFVVTTGALRGVLEAKQRFGVVNAIRIPLGAVTFLGPWAVAQYTVSLPAAVLVLTLARIVAWAAHAYYCRSLLAGEHKFRAN
ncbi:MAG TPA: oligosaccharide flippase family protein, partial [Burkholderiales bacterium]